jgi:hypothetical protein
VIQRGEEFGFALEADDPIRVAGESVGEDLERDVAFKAGVLCPVDLAL